MVCLHRLLTFAWFTGKTWKAFSEAQSINIYRERLVALTEKLNGAVGMHTARNSERLVVGGKEACSKAKLSSYLLCSKPASNSATRNAY